VREGTACCSVLQCVAVEKIRRLCCSVLQCFALYCSVESQDIVLCVVTCGSCSVLLCVAVCCNVLRWRKLGYGVAEFCSVLQCVAVCCCVLQCVTVRCRVLQCHGVAMYCSGENQEIVLQCVAVCCNVMQSVAACCSCHEALRGKGLFESHDYQRLLLHGETLLLCSHEMMMI